MNWAVRSIFGFVIGTCVVLAVLVGPLTKFFTKNVSRRPVANAAEASGSASGRARATDSPVAAMQIQNRVERNNIVARIGEEFGIEVDPDRFGSHHTARDYLERLRLARQAKELGFDVDPEAFGDDQFMRQHIEALQAGRASVGQARSGGTAMLREPAAHAAAPDCQDYIFIYGHRYYPDGRGAYVRADGTVLGLSTARQTPPTTDAAADSNKPSDAALLGTDLLGNLDELLGLLGPPSTEER